MGAHTSSGPLEGVSDGNLTPVLPANKVVVGPSGVVTSTTPSQTQPDATSYMYAASVVGTPFGFGLNADAASGSVRSNQVVVEPILDQDEQLVGYIRLSEGPAYGRQILESVAIGSAVAGGVAILAAAGVGWWMSRHITSPLRDLAAVTARMAGGDLSARANLSRRDEFGVLSRSFDLMADRVETTVGALRRFVADAAHELQTPLTALRTNLELAPEDSFVHQAQSQARRIWVLVQSLLDLSRLEAGESVKGKASIDVVQLMQELGEQYASRAQQAGLAYDVTIPTRPVVIQGNKAQILQALSNLLDNAIKFTDEGGRIQVGVSQETTHVTLWVEDTGIGVPEEDLPHIYDRFHRGRNAAHYPGSGLGLAIAKAVVDNHGGTIIVKSAVDQGAKCSLCFPMGL
jgi:signal transduction histidine kinase